MACTIPYLRELPLDEGTILKLEEIDIDIKSRFLSSGLFENKEDVKPDTVSTILLVSTTVFVVTPIFTA